MSKFESRYRYALRGCHKTGVIRKFNTKERVWHTICAMMHLVGKPARRGREVQHGKEDYYGSVVGTDQVALA
jgi:hypothetical protein